MRPSETGAIPWSPVEEAELGWIVGLLLAAGPGLPDAGTLDLPAQVCQRGRGGPGLEATCGQSLQTSAALQGAVGPEAAKVRVGGEVSARVSRAPAAAVRPKGKGKAVRVQAEYRLEVISNRWGVPVGIRAQLGVLLDRNGAQSGGQELAVAPWDRARDAARLLLLDWLGPAFQTGEGMARVFIGTTSGEAPGARPDAFGPDPRSRALTIGLNLNF